MDLSRQLAESLRRLREEAGLTQTQMAKRLGISQPTLNRLESASQNTTLKMLDQLCQALRCSVGDLFETGQVQLPRVPRKRGRDGPGRLPTTSP
jgi:transcriptional regulator with XRE-family HTH domain